MTETYYNHYFGKIKTITKSCVYPPPPPLTQNTAKLPSRHIHTKRVFGCFCPRLEFAVMTVVQVYFTELSVAHVIQNTSQFQKELRIY